MIALGANDMKKILFLDVDFDDFGDYFREKRSSYDNVLSLKVYNNLPVLIRKVLLFLGYYVNKRFLWLAYGEWKYELDKYDHIIIPSRRSCSYAIERIAATRSVIVYYWNIVSEKEINPQTYLNNKNVILCTFDPDDAKKYSMRFVDTYLFPVEDSKYEINTDLFYVGIERPQRTELLEYIKSALIQYNLTFDFHIMKFNDKKNRMSYKKVLEHSQHAKVIVDLNRENQAGLTIRPIEALILKKKLITNNKNIKNFDFYNSKNIFILGEDNIENLYHFITEPYSEINMGIVENYYFENWLRKVLNYDQR